MVKFVVLHYKTKLKNMHTHFNLVCVTIQNNNTSTKINLLNANLYIFIIQRIIILDGFT